jgi:hypothetical protein
MLGAVSNASFGGLRASIDAVSHGAALHKDDGMVPVLASDGRGQAKNITRLRTPRHQLKTCRRKVVALVSDQVAVIGDHIGHLTSAHETLDQRDIDDAGWFAPATTDGPDMLRIDIKECLEALNPLGEQLSAMDKD